VTKSDFLTSKMAASKMAAREEDSGYECDFVTPPDDSLYCRICLSVARDPRQHGLCGQLYCKSCLEKHAQREKKCPCCKKEKAKYFEDNRSKYFMNSHPNRI